MEDRKLTKDDSIRLLQEKYACLKEQGINRYPQRSDFSEREVVAIKAFFGPWPRALEAAKIKPPRYDDHQSKTRKNGQKSKLLMQ